jgi:hypothetical protein
VDPQTLFLFGLDPAMDEFDRFLSTIRGLIKYALRARAGRFDLTRAAARTSQRTSTVREGINFLRAAGYLAVLQKDDESWYLAAHGKKREPSAVAASKERLKELLTETAAYRAYLRNAPSDAWVIHGSSYPSKDAGKNA